MKKRLPVFEKFALIYNGNFGVSATIVMIIGLIGSFYTFKNLDLESIYYLRNNVHEGKGKITGIYETNTTINDVPVCGYEYVFYSPIGDLEWVSFTTGYKYNVGDIVDVEYSVIRPDVNRIKGMKSSPGGLLFSLFFVLPLFVGIVWILINVFNGFKKIRLIENGVFSRAKLIRKEATATEINERRVYRLTFVYNAKNGKDYKVVSKTHKPELLEDDRTELLIYDVNNPKKAIMVDTLPWTLPKYIIAQNWS